MSKSWFSGTHLSVPQVMLITYMLTRNYSVQDVMHEVPSVGVSLGPVTLANWNQFVRQVNGTNLP